MYYILHTRIVEWRPGDVWSKRILLYYVYNNHVRCTSRLILPGQVSTRETR